MSKRVLSRRPVHWVAVFRGRLSRLVTAVLGVALLVLAIGGTITAGRAAALDDLDHTLASEAAANASALNEYFELARSLILLLAHDSAFRQFEPGRAPTAQTQIRSMKQANAAMAHLEQLYPSGISEACLIDGTGQELARVVLGKGAPASELSTEEAQAPFFAPTMRLPEGRVYQSAPYVSLDTGLWVISNSTPIMTSTGRPWGLVHFEVALEGFRPGTDAGREQGFSASIVATGSGRILVEDGRPVAGTVLGRGGSKGLKSLVMHGPAVESGTVDGHRVAVARLSVQKDNSNSWAVVAAARADTVGWSRTIGPTTVLMILAALLLLGFAGLNMRSSHRKLRAASLTDELTGLPNRRLLIDRLEQALLLAGRRGTMCGVLLVDLDRFKEVNDTLGHHHGDQLLRGVADRLRDAFRVSDTVARLGGDEFAVLLPEVGDEASALALAGRFLTALDREFVVEGVVLNVEVSIGLSLAPHHGNDANDLLRAADVAMYEAKEAKCGVSVYDPERDGNTPTRLALLGDLRRALQVGELFMLFQPKLHLSTDAIHSVEALVRWQHPTRGILTPDDFIPVAESTGLIMPLTMQTLDLAIAQARLWLDREQPIQVAVNLSPRCLLDTRFPASVQGVLHRHSVPAGLLRLEVTESAVMADPARALAILTELQLSGIALSIDDFGTGYSSMSYLKRLPVDELKIDRSFITHMLGKGSDSVLVRSAIDLGHNLGMSVVAEGVEDASTLAKLKALGCDVIQGYHLGHPMSAAALGELLGARIDRKVSTTSPTA